MLTLTPAAPVTQSERIPVLDSLRGMAILGILIMNIVAFSGSVLLGSDPSINNETGLNYYLWYIMYGVFNGTQRAFFSILFGAGIILFISRQEKRLDGLAPADYFFRRQLWLILFSLIDVYLLLWDGDILLEYACFGLLLFVFRKLPPKTLLIAAGICLVFAVARDNRDLYKQKTLISKGEALAAADTTQIKLTPLDKEAIGKMEGIKKRSTQESKLAHVAEDNIHGRGDYATVYEYRVDSYIHFMNALMYLQLWDVLTCFFLGMALFKTDILTGKASIKVYAGMALIGLPLGIFLSYLRINNSITYNFNGFEIAKHTYMQIYQIDRILRSLGLLGVVMLMYRSGWFKGFFTILAPVGQMAFTNYLGQSLICGLIFNGFAFGLFGMLERYETYFVVLGVWVFQIIFSNIWMRFFLSGPLEWAWRSLTYWKVQPLRRASL